MDEHGYYSIVTTKVLQYFSHNTEKESVWIDIPLVKWNPDPMEYLKKVQELKKLPINSDHWRY